ncbi:MAG: PEP-CTERM/exosortase system-associated acyltransferase [Nitrosomonas sp.]|uniref:PEP-CTERM/exosortase system-associated acyltransferase n=1 Tax=Nitrosomonas sp. TaxID=42353 RepID=UPI002B393574|nr:PEP-CTERM/exosortase system-associated acyltransferase [Nitrosomonas sp.]MEB2331447.1 PEP-CTERM/exosortase system-associated acyltransferase [Nitrosomonas sp.]
MFAQNTTHLGTAFKQYFEIVPALTKELKREAYYIRHSVYCEDLGYEPTQPDKFELDEYDAYALHLLIHSIKQDAFIGCVRIITPPTDDPNWLLPFEKACINTLNRSIIDPGKLPRKQIAEVSRLAVLSSFRQRKGEANSPISLSDNDLSPSPAPRFPYIPLGLYYGAVELARLYNIKVLFLLTEERLANHFNKLGIQIKFIGSPVNHRGLRFPSMVNVNKTIDSIRPIFRPLYQAIAEDIKAELEKKNH